MRNILVSALVLGVSILAATDSAHARNHGEYGQGHSPFSTKPNRSATAPLLSFFARSVDRTDTGKVRGGLRHRRAELNAGFRRAVRERRRVRLRLELFPGTSITAEQTGLQYRDDGFTWFGTVNDELGDVVLTVVDQMLRGTVHYRGREYLLLGNGEKVIDVQDVKPLVFGVENGGLGHSVLTDLSDVPTRDLAAEGRLPQETWRPSASDDVDALTSGIVNDYGIGQLPFERRRYRVQRGYKLAVDDGSVIDFLPIVTAAALGYAGSEAQLALIVQHSVNVLNQALNESGANTFINMLPLRRVPHSEFSDQEMELKALINPEDGNFDEVHQFRDQDAADIMVLIGGPDAYSPSGGTASARTEPVDNRVFSEQAFAVVAVDSIADHSFLLAHEVGHLFGVGHDWATQPLPAPKGFNPAKFRPEAHGYVTLPLVNPAGGEPVRYVTLVSYFTECIQAGPTGPNCDRIMRFSNPLHYIGHTQLDGTSAFVALGRGLPHAKAADAVRTINAAAKDIALHRLSACRAFPTAPVCP